MAGLAHVDAQGRRRRWDREPQTIVSLVPSDTYNLAVLGLTPRLVGRTEYCVEPAEVRDVPTIGGTKNVDVDAIVALAPDLVIANQEENRRIDVERLEAAGVPVVVGFPKTVRQGLEHTAAVAALFPSVDAAPRLDAAWAQYERLARRVVSPVPTFVPIWMAPLMTVHEETFISDALELAGGRNVFSDRRRRYPLAADQGRRPAVAKPGRDTRYPRISEAELRERAPALVLLPDEPHAFCRADADVLQAIVGPEVAVRFCEGRDLMWYGLRAVEGLSKVAAILDEVRERA